MGAKTHKTHVSQRQARRCLVWTCARPLPLARLTAKRTGAFWAPEMTAPLCKGEATDRRLRATLRWLRPLYPREQGDPVARGAVPSSVGTHLGINIVPLFDIIF